MNRFTNDDEGLSFRCPYPLGLTISIYLIEVYDDIAYDRPYHSSFLHND